MAIRLDFLKEDFLPLSPERRLQLVREVRLSRTTAKHPMKKERKTQAKKERSAPQRNKKLKTLFAGLTEEQKKELLSSLEEIDGAS